MTTIAPSPQTDQIPCHPTLALEAALASRIIRSGKIPRQLVQWLATPEQFAECDAAFTDARITKLLNEVIAPLRAEACQWEQKEAHYAAPWLGAVCCAAASHYSQLQLGIGPRLLAASLLPLYRSLASGQLSEGLAESRFRLSEMLTLLALCYEVGKDLTQLLDPLNRRMEAPNKILSNHFKLELVCVAQIVREQLASFDPTTLQFNDQGVGALMRFDPQQMSFKVVDWAAPELLWRLSGELISHNTELVLPRAWIETPVPWHNIADHWNRLALQLSSRILNKARPTTAAGCSASVETTALDGCTESNVTVRLADDDADRALASLNDLNDLLDTTSHTLNASSATTADSHATPPSVSPRVLIAEIRSHNDPVFVNVIRRQIVKCRSEERAVSLVSTVVLPEDGNDHHEVHENGLTLWQQRLVNWLAEHPHVVEPHAFLTSDGELLLCLLDLERNETTSLIRHGLVEVLTGRQLDDSKGDLLAKVNVPARYHAGISSTSSPGANFTAEQLIAPAMRCLSAARLHGKASIKSIEVY